MFVLPLLFGFFVGLIGFLLCVMPAYESDVRKGLILLCVGIILWAWVIIAFLYLDDTRKETIVESTTVNGIDLIVIDDDIINLNRSLNKDVEENTKFKVKPYKEFWSYGLSFPLKYKYEVVNVD